MIGIAHHLEIPTKNIIKLLLKSAKIFWGFVGQSLLCLMTSYENWVSVGFVADIHPE